MELGQDIWPSHPTQPDPVVERCETNPRQRLDSSISYLSENSKPFSGLIYSITHIPYTYDQNRNIIEML